MIEGALRAARGNVTLAALRIGWSRQALYRRIHALGLRAGQRVRVESAAGAFETTVRIFSGAQPGVVNVPYGLHTHAQGWGTVRGANPLVAVGRRVDGVSGLPDWYSTNVRLTAI